MEEKSYAKLFNNFDFVSKEHLEIFLQTMDNNVATQTIVHAVKTAYERGAFTIGEVEVISKTIRVLSELQDKEN
jgi:hypothetical protein